ncbi:hypothetical protein [Sphingomonas sp. VNH70]|uniref:hypothetical protein n=1 Tax=Sphingomonas silueang TaxID=3156617 RepID=UPI0032B35C67
MAYVDFSGDPERAVVAAASAPQLAAPAPARFSPLEWSVVALARRDRLSSLASPGRLSTALGKVFAVGGRNPRLADPRLEALRRIAVLSWRRGVTVPAREVEAFLRAGFSAGHYETMLTSIAAAQAHRGARA